MPGRVLGERWHGDRHAAQAGLLRAVGLGVLQDGAQLVIARDDVITLIGVGPQYRAGRARIGQDLPQPFAVGRVEEVEMGGEVLNLKGGRIIDACHMGPPWSKPTLTLMILTTQVVSTPGSPRSAT